MRRSLAALALWLLTGSALANALEEGNKALQAQRWADAYRLLLPEAQKGNSFAQYNVALLLSKGWGVKQDLPQAAHWYQRAADGGDNDAKTNLGLMYAEGSGVKKDFQKAARLYREAADAGVGMAQNNLGAAYLRGEGVERSNREALKWFQKAADQNVPVAQNSLAALYCEGRSSPDKVEKNSDLCTKWLQRAAALGFEPAQKNIFTLTREKAEKGSVEAMHNLGAYYLKGMGTAANVQEGVKWFTKAAEAGRKESQLILSQLYERGAYGVPRDSKKAAYWKKMHEN